MPLVGNAVTEAEEDLYFYWILEGGHETEDRLKEEGYKWIYFAPTGAPELNQEHAVVTGELEYGDLIFTKELIPFRQLKGLNLKMVSAGIQNEAVTQHILEFYEGREDPIIVTQPGVGGLFVAVVHPATRPGVAWQASKFDKEGPYGHIEAPTQQEAVRRLAQEGFRDPDPQGLRKIGFQHNPPYSGWSSGWWRKKIPDDTEKISYQRKRDALNVFLDYNHAIVDDYGGPSMKHSPESFEAINHRFDIRDPKRKVDTIAKAVWWALPPGSPYYLEDIDVELLNRTAPAIYNPRGLQFQLPDHVEEAALLEQEAEYYLSKYGDLYGEDDEEVPF